MDMTTYSYSQSGDPQFVLEPIPNETITIVARDIFREYRGMHAQVGIFYKTLMLAYDEFNVTRNEDRGRLAKSAHKVLPEKMQVLCGGDELKNHLDRFCLWLSVEWEAARFSIEEFDPNEQARPASRVLAPYITQGSGTIFFGAPGSGKSMLAHLMGMMIANGMNGFWKTEQRPMLYVNLERPRDTFLWREANLKRTLGVKGFSHVRFLHARGYGLSAVSAKLKEFVRANPGSVVAMDSVSRGQMGKLKDDDTANRWTDMMNSSCETWYALGHTPRATDDHMFGSVHFDAGVDMAVQVTAQEKDNELGVALAITKANDAAKGKPEYLAFTFDPNGLAAVRRAEAYEFPDLLNDSKKQRLEKLVGYVEKIGHISATKAAQALNIPRPDISDWFNNSGRFEGDGKAGREVLFKVAEQNKDA